MTAARRSSTPVSPITRALLWANLVVVFIAGLALYPLATRADTDFAWSIKAPITAAFLGAGYWGTLLTIGLALAQRGWQTVRILIVSAFVLTGLMSLPTVIYAEEFHLDEGSATARAVAWTWWLLYVGQPWALVALFVLQERAGGWNEYTVEEPLGAPLRAVLLGHGVALSLLGIIVWPLRLDGFWPWALPDLAAAAVAVWLLAFGAGFWWALRDGDWRRVRIAVPAYLAFLVLVALAVARYSEALDNDWRIWTFLGALLVSFATLASTAWWQEKEYRAEGAAVVRPA